MNEKIARVGSLIVTITVAVFAVCLLFPTVAGAAEVATTGAVSGGDFGMGLIGAGIATGLSCIGVGTGQQQKAEKWRNESGPEAYSRGGNKLQADMPGIR